LFEINIDLSLFLKAANNDNIMVDGEHPLYLIEGKKYKLLK